MAGGLTNSGLSCLAVFALGNTDGITTFGSTGAYIAVGSASTAFDASSTTMNAELDRRGMDSGYPTRSGASMTWKATFAAASAVGGWNEIGIFNNSSAGSCLARDVADYGDKPGSQAWALIWTATLQVD